MVMNYENLTTEELLVEAMLRTPPRDPLFLALARRLEQTLDELIDLRADIESCVPGGVDVRR
jgi:hypothetical protein